MGKERAEKKVKGEQAKGQRQGNTLNKGHSCATLNRGAKPSGSVLVINNLSLSDRPLICWILELEILELEICDCSSRNHSRKEKPSSSFGPSEGAFDQPFTAQRATLDPNPSQPFTRHSQRATLSPQPSQPFTCDSQCLTLSPHPFQPFNRDS